MTMIAVTAAVVVFLSQHCINLPVVQSESVWHQLQDHTAASHVKRQQQKNGDKIYNYPLLFTDTKIPASKAPSPSSSADAVIPTPSLLTTSTRNGRNMFMSMTKMMMMTTTTTAKASVSTPSTSSSIGNSTMTTQQSLKVTKSKKSSSPTASNAPSVVGASIYPTVIEGKTKTMMRMSMNGHKNQRTTPSPSVSAQPTYLDDDGTLSPYPTIAGDVDKKGMMMIMSKNRKDQSPTLSPSISAEPTYIEDESSLYPSSTSNDGDNNVKARKGMGGSMSKDKKDKGTTPSPSVSAEPTYIEEDESSFNPTIVNGKGMGGGGSMSKDQKDKVTTPSPSISAEPTYIEDETLYPTTAKGGDTGKGGMTMMSMSSMMSKGDDEETISPSASLVPSTTMVPTLSNNSKGSGGMMSGSSMMDSSMNMMMMSKGIYENPKMMMKKGPDDSKMNMSKMTLPPVPTLPETFIPTTAPNVLPTPPAPSPSPNNRVQLSPYTLRYTFNQTRIPLTFEVDEVVAVTRMYLAEYFEIRYMDMTEFVTNMTGTAFVLQQPFVINYTSVAVFNTVASMNDDDSVNIDIPPVEELDIILIAAFTTINLLNYITILQDLPPENIFRTTSNVTFMIDTMPDSNTNNTLRIKNENDDGQNKKGSRQSAKVTAGIATGAGVLVLALISVLAIRSRKNRNDIMHIDDHDMPPNKRNLNNQVDDEGHMTVAGDTYLAESTVISGGTTSILSSLSATRQRRNQRFKSKRILSQSRALVLAQPHPPSNESQYLTLTQPPPPPPPSSSPSDISLLRGFSDNGSNDHYEHDDNASDQEIYENDDFDNNDDRSLLPFYTSSPEPAYQGALTVDVNERRHGGQPQDVLLSMRDDMRLPRHFRSQQISTSKNDKQQHYCDDHGNHISNQMVVHHDIDENDDDTLSVDDDVPLRVIDLIRKFTPSRRRTSR